MNSAASEPALIGIDWGTTSLRAFLIAADGTLLDKAASSEGILHVPDRDFEAVFDRCVGRWMEKRRLPVLASGMITSRNGWIETPYAQAPLSVDDLARALVGFTTNRGTEVHFVTGVATEHTSGPDVMRGEETQIIGASGLDMSDGDFVLPGTHSKWVRVSGGRIVNFATFMTGEIFAALLDHTILGTLAVKGPFLRKGFDLGVAAGVRDGASLLHDLFHARTLPLMGRIEGGMVADYVSGMLIGAEIAAAKARGDATSEITLIGRSDLADRYEVALHAAGIGTKRAPDDIVAGGHLRIARSAGLIA